MVKNKKSFMKYPLCIVAILSAMIMMLNMLSAAAEGTIGLGIDGLDVTYSGSADIANELAQSGFDVSVAGKGSNGCMSTNTGRVVFKNTTSQDYVISFDYSVSGGGYSTLSGTDISGTGSTGFVLISAGSDVTLSITSPTGASNKRTINVSNIKYTAAPVVKGDVTNVVTNNEGKNSDGTPDDGATAFITELTQLGGGEATVGSVTWEVTSPAKGATKSFTKSGELPNMTFGGDGASVKIALLIDGLYDSAATADVTVD